MKKSKYISFILMITLLFTLLQPFSVQAATKLNKNKSTISVGSSTTLKLKGAKKTVKWSTSKKSVATVSKNGKVTGKSAGTATITAKAGKKKYTCKVTVQEKFSLKKAKKKLSASSSKLNDGVVAIVENKYNYPVSVEAIITYYDKKKKIIATAEEDNAYLNSNNKCVLFFYAPFDGSKNKANYDSYKISYQLSNIITKSSNFDDIVYGDSIQNDKVKVNVVNLGKKHAEYTQIAIVYYKDKQIVGYNYKYVKVKKANSSADVYFPFPHDADNRLIKPDDYKVFINFSYWYK